MSQQLCTSRVSKKSLLQRLLNRLVHTLNAFNAGRVVVNEGLLKQKKLCQATYDLEREQKLSNVFGGENYEINEDIRTQVLDKIGTNRFTRQKFMDRFDQMELT